MSTAENLQNPEMWKRGLFILLFGVVFGFSEVAVWGTALVQFAMFLITGSPNPQLAKFAQQLSTFIYQVVSFMTFRSEEKPFPFSDWPSGSP
jgi:hypothetical protein